MKDAGQEFVFDAAFARDFNQDIKHLQDATRKCRNLTFGYETILWMCHVLRWLTGFAAFIAPRYALLIGALQFLLAPFSFPIAVMKLATYAPEGIIHYLLAMFLGPLIGGYGPAFTVNTWFFCGFLAADQVLNLVVYLLWSEPFQMRRLLCHVVYGTANTKVYYLVAFGCLHGVQVNIVLVVLTSVLTVVVLNFVMPALLGALGLPCHDVRFYMDHRIGHIPVVYTHAHKMHHQLHDTTPWDAHLYGNGMNEHYFLMVLDILPCMLAGSVFHVPYCFSGYLLYISWINKVHHTRLKLGTPYDHLENFHADHHTLHTKNFSLMNGALLDFYFGTQGDTTSGTNGVGLIREERKATSTTVDQIVIKVTSMSARRAAWRRHTEPILLRSSLNNFKAEL